MYKVLYIIIHLEILLELSTWQTKDNILTLSQTFKNNLFNYRTILRTDDVIKITLGI